jgi:hypothetical protein
MKKLLTYLLLLAGFSGCIKETSWNKGDPGITGMVVDGRITDERKSHEIILTRPVGTLNQSPTPVTGAVVLIANEDSSWQLIETPVKSGIYKTDSDFIALVNKNYTLEIFTDGQVYTAQTKVEPGRYFTELSYLPNDNDSLYHIDWRTSSFSTEYPAMWEVKIDWSLVPGYEQADPAKCRARLLFYTLPSLDVSEIFAPEVEQVSFPYGSNITEIRYSLTSENASFIRELLLETSWTGSFFPTANANVESNVSNNGFGFFGASGVTRLSLVVR